MFACLARLRACAGESDKTIIDGGENQNAVPI
jgi:hypothetical protein